MSARLVERVRYGSRGQGSLARFSDSENWVSIYCVRGKEHRESTATPDLKKARKFHKQKLDEIAADRQGLRKFVAPIAQRVTVKQLLDDLEADQRLRELKSLKMVVDHARIVRNHFGTWRAVDVSAAAVDRFIEQSLAAGLANATVNRRLQILGAALKLGVDRKLLHEVPKIRRLPERNIRRGFFERHEVEAVVDALPEHLRDLVWFAYYTGWRKAEVVGLRWDMVDTSAGTLTLPDSKNGRGRVLALSGELAAIMARWEEARLYKDAEGEPRVADLVFHRRGRSVGDFKKSWHSALVKAGLTHLEKAADGSLAVVHDKLFHDLRRTAARNLVRAGVREGVAMAVTGHRTRSIFDRYNITDARDVRDAMERVSKEESASPRGS